MEAVKLKDITWNKHACLNYFDQKTKLLSWWLLVAFLTFIGCPAGTERCPNQSWTNIISVQGRTNPEPILNQSDGFIRSATVRLWFTYVRTHPFTFWFSRTDPESRMPAGCWILAELSTRQLPIGAGHCPWGGITARNVVNQSNSSVFLRLWHTHGKFIRNIYGSYGITHRNKWQSSGDILFSNKSIYMKNTDLWKSQMTDIHVLMKDPLGYACLAL